MSISFTETAQAGVIDQAATNKEKANFRRVDRIIGDIESVANDPASSRQPGRRGRIVVDGSRDGVDIEVIIEGDRKTIVTGFPTNTPRNPKGPE